MEQHCPDYTMSLVRHNPNAASIVVGDILTKRTSCRTLFNTSNDQHVRPLLHTVQARLQGSFAARFWKIRHFVAILFMPEYKQRFRHEAPVTRDVLWDTLHDMDWNMFRPCADDINKFAKVAVSFVRCWMLAADIIPTATVTAVAPQVSKIGRLDKRGCLVTLICKPFQRLLINYYFS